MSAIRRGDLLRPGDRVAVAVSGGADSVALLRLLLELRDELGLVLSVSHFNHRLRAEAAEDESFVRDMASRYGLPFHLSGADVALHARENRCSLEAAARELRYAFFTELMARGDANRVATGHTLDDQAETVLLRLVRGAGTRGLAAILPRIDLVKDGQCLSVVRPLLGVGRDEIEAYLRELGQNWRTDATNADPVFTRNRVRHSLLPRIAQEFNPAIRRALAETAEVARAESDFLDSCAAGLGAVRVSEDGNSAILDARALSEAHPALGRVCVRNALAELGAPAEFDTVERVREIACGGGKRRDLGGGWCAERRRDGVVIRRGAEAAPQPYAYRLEVPGSVLLPEIGIRISADGQAERELTVRPWRAGDRFHAVAANHPKKVKELLTARHVTGSERAAWPVVAEGDRLLWLRGFGMPADAPPGLLITEVSIEADGAGDAENR